MARLDLHTHSEASKDGSITPEQFARVLREEKLDVIAITDHDRIDFAKGLQNALGRDKIIVGEEITTSDGEIIGLYLKSRVEPGQTALATVKAIKKQGGLVYIPHPFETFRKGIQKDKLHEIADYVDIIEGCNGRAFAQNFGPQATAWARKHGKAVAASSDAHGSKGIGHTYTFTKQKPKKENLVDIIHESRLVHRRPPLQTLLYPKFNRFRKFIVGQR